MHEINNLISSVKYFPFSDIHYFNPFLELTYMYMILTTVGNTIKFEKTKYLCLPYNLLHNVVMVRRHQSKLTEG